MAAKQGRELPADATESHPAPQKPAGWDAFFDRPGIDFPDREQPRQSQRLSFDTGEPDVGEG